MSLQLFRRGEATLPLIFASCAAIGLLALGARAEAADFSGSAALTTDYVLRGITQTQGDPAAQAGFKAAAESGLLRLGVGLDGRVSRRQRARPRSTTWSAGAASWPKTGRSTSTSPLPLSGHAGRTRLTGADRHADISRNYWLMFGYSPDAFASDESGTMRWSARSSRSTRVPLRSGARALHPRRRLRRQLLARLAGRGVGVQGAVRSARHRARHRFECETTSSATTSPARASRRPCKRLSRGERHARLADDGVRASR